MAGPRVIALGRGLRPTLGEPSLQVQLARELDASKCWSSIVVFSQGDPPFEIDLLVLGHHAVYVVEYKKSSQRGATELRDALEQARHAAALLSEFFAQSLPATVPIEPVVLIPNSELVLSVPADIRARVLTPIELSRAAEFGILPLEPQAIHRVPLDEASAIAVQDTLDQIRARPQPGRGRLKDELPLLVRDAELDLRGRVEHPGHTAAFWIIACSFARSLEERHLFHHGQFDGPEHSNGESALAHADPGPSEGKYLIEVLKEIHRTPFGEVVLRDSMHLLTDTLLSDSMARKLLAFFRRRGESGKSRWRFTDGTWTDIYQHISENTNATLATIATPTFVNEFILDITLTPAIDEAATRTPSVIDPACGSGLLLSAAFRRIYHRSAQAAPKSERLRLATAALEHIHGADLNPIAVLIAKIRLALAFLDLTGIRRLGQMPAIPLNIVVADSLLANSETAPFDHAHEPEHESRPRAYDVVVCEPPYVTCTDPERRQIYRALYPRSFSLKAPLVGPFVQRCLALARPGGFVGIFASSSFTKRRFGKRMVEQLLANVDLTRVIDTSSAYIPGHGVPTLVLCMRNRAPTSAAVVVVGGKRAERIRPADPAKGEVWSTIAAHYNSPGYDDKFITVAAVPREHLAVHPWSLESHARNLRDRIQQESSLCLGDIADIEHGSMSGQDDVFILSPDHVTRLGLEQEVILPFITGGSIRDWVARPDAMAIVPDYDMGQEHRSVAAGSRWLSYLSRYQPLLASRPIKRSVLAQSWWRWSRWRSRPAHGIRFLCANTAITNHFSISTTSAATALSVSSIYMHKPDHETALAVLGFLNSSAACFWMKETSFYKSSANDASSVYEFGPQLANLPIPRKLLDHSSIREAVIAVVNRLVEAAGEQVAYSPDRILRGWGGTSQGELIQLLADAQMRELAIVRRMVYDQEELDWLVYAALGLVDVVAENARGSALPTQRPFLWLSDEPPPNLDRRLAEPWSRRRAAVRESSPLQLLETASMKRPFRSRWKVPDLSTMDSQELAYREHDSPRISAAFRARTLAACESWLLDRTEEVFRRSQPRALTSEELASRLAASPGASDIISLLGEASDQGAASMPQLFEANAVSFLASFRHSDVGMNKRKEWQLWWQTMEPHRASVNMPEQKPPRYGPRDYRDAVTWRLRGASDVPQERFIRYSDASINHGPTLYGWAGWNDEQRLGALEELAARRTTTDTTQIVAFLAGMLELLPLPWMHRADSEALIPSRAERIVENVASHAGITLADVRVFAVTGQLPT